MSRDNVQQQLAALAAAFRAQLPGRIDEISGHMKDVLPAAGVSVLSGVRDSAHKLAGAGATFGLKTVGDKAKTLENACDSVIAKGGALDDASLGTVTSAFKALIDTATSEIDAAPVQTATVEGTDAEDDVRPVIYIKSNNPSEFERIKDDLTTFGFDAEPLNASGGNGSVARPAAVAADLTGTTKDDLAPLIESEDPPPVFLFHAEDSIRSRLAAVRLGGAGFLRSPVDVVDLLQLLAAQTDAALEEPCRVVVIDDDPPAALLAKSVLEKAGMAVETVQQPLAVMDVLDSFVPDLFLMDIHMPECSGIELAILLRQDDRFASIPILFLTGDDDSGRQFDAVNAGGAGFLKKPVEGAQLVSAVRTLTRQSRRLRGIADRDPLTGAFNHSYLKQQLSRDVDRARRERTSLTYVVLAIDHFPTLNAAHGYAVGDRVLRRLATILRTRIRGTDTCGRLSGSKFGLILSGAGVQEAEALVADLRDALAEIEVIRGAGPGGLTLSCGLAGFPKIQEALMISDAAEAGFLGALDVGGDTVVRR